MQTRGRVKASLPNPSRRCLGFIGVLLVAWAPPPETDLAELPQTFQLRSVLVDKVAAVPDDQSVDGAPAQLLDATGAAAQRWALSFLADGAVAIRNLEHAKVLGIADASTQDNAAVRIATYRDAPGQRWRVHDGGNDRVTFVNEGSGRCLSVLNERTDSGAPLVQSACRGSRGEYWRMTRVDTQPSLPKPAPVAGRTTGMYYAVSHWPAWTAMNEARAAGRPSPSVETVLRSRRETGASIGPGYTFALLQPSDEADPAYYQYDPQAGFYCIYHARSPGAVNYHPDYEGIQGRRPKPDCPMYKAILERHAQQLNALGIDFVFADMSRFAEDDASTDATQTRPFEVLLEQWQALLVAGRPGPGVAAWQRLPKGPAHPHDGHTYAVHRVLAVYNDPAHGDAVMRDPVSGKKLFLYRAGETTDPAWPAFIADNGGRKDVVAVAMSAPESADHDTPWLPAGACAAGAPLTDAACDLAMARHPTLGSQSAVSPAYDGPRGSGLPFDAVGVHAGLTLRKQFWSALAQQPNWLLVHGWNRHVAHVRQLPPHSPKSPGFETDPTMGERTFVGAYGTEYSRDIEPGQLPGAPLYLIAQSCLRLYRAGHAACTDMNELCCRGGNFSDNYRYHSSSGGLFELYAPQHPAADTRELYTCRQGAHVFVSIDAHCAGHTRTGTPGRIGATRGGFTLRPLYSCQDDFGTYYETLTGTCDPGRLRAILGYVH